MLFTARDGPVKSLRGLIDLAKASPGKYSYISPGAGSPIYAVSEMLKLRAGIDLLGVPFRELGPMLNGLASGDVTVFFTSPATVSSIINRLTPLAVASNRRLPNLPNLFRHRPVARGTVVHVFDVSDEEHSSAPRRHPPTGAE